MRSSADQRQEPPSSSTSSGVLLRDFLNLVPLERLHSSIQTQPPRLHNFCHRSRLRLERIRPDDRTGVGEIDHPVHSRVVARPVACARRRSDHRSWRTTPNRRSRGRPSPYLQRLPCRRTSPPGCRTYKEYPEPESCPSASHGGIPRRTETIRPDRLAAPGHLVGKMTRGLRHGPVGKNLLPELVKRLVPTGS